MNNKILIIEDEPTLRNALVDKFIREGLIVISANDGKEGLESALKNRPDLILLDIIMPIMDGMTMLTELRKDNWGKSIPVILLTNLSEPKKNIKSKVEETKTDYMMKSDWKIKDIVKRVFNLLT
jgi:DNA-binding response OmpR family regulator